MPDSDDATVEQSSGHGAEEDITGTVCYNSITCPMQVSDVRGMLYPCILSCAV